MSIQPRIDICLTSISSRLDTLHFTISSLLEQEYSSFSVNLYLSTEPFLLDKGVSTRLPASLETIRRADTRFKVWFVPNWGSYRKAIPYLMSGSTKRRLFVTSDDDTIYPVDWLGKLVSAYQEHHGIICYRGHAMMRDGREFLPYRRWMTNGIECNPDLFIVPTGKDGVLYDTALIHPRIVDIDAALKIAPTADDLWFKWHTAAVGATTFVINTDYTSDTFAATDFSDSLYSKFNKGGKNDETLARLEAYGREELDFDFAGLQAA